ncbi:hypothetical protein C5Y96_15915 [Blastopirellula marina]|uniref:Uncharacterized protein n=1 Tax=Blastopirellula marina TaxID=124 RepID=A0A2S8FAQ3_9BACT|nr:MULTISPECIES: hypothetical protein [Pirellulaceae]PQO29231.1 hypothetical protein C5Y96_15915 [Blastopirellula marina]RCS50424.1 hypothetical protein DTL36_15935 [Bremerella cremea]
MAAANRANVFTACHKVIKKHYTTAGPDKRSILEQLVFAAILENAPHKVAEECYGMLQSEYFDWNEVRVTSVPELSEMFAKHPISDVAASRVKTLLQNIFEAIYTYDLEGLKKGNQGKAVASIEKYGATPFVVGYVTQHGLGGHSIPVDRALLNLMFVLGAITDKELEKQTIPGMERAVPKTKGVEFSDMVHELAVDFQNAPFSKKIRDLLLEISPDAKSRFPKRVSEEPAPAKEEPAKQAPAPEATTKKKSTSAKETTKKAAPTKAAKSTKSTAPKKKTAKAEPTKKKATKSTTKKAAPKKTSTRITKKKPK